MRQRSLNFHQKEADGENQLVGVGMCTSAGGQYYKSYRVESAASEYECLSMLDASASATSKVLGVEFHKPSQACDILVSGGDKIEPYMFSRPIALKLNAQEGADPASGAIFGGDETEGWKCWKRVPGYFFKAVKTATCSAWQVDVKECPYKSCETCTPTACIFGAWSAWSEASCTQLCERHRVISRMNHCGGDPCNGPLISTMHCRKDCEDPVDCLFDEWTSWDASTCEGGRGQKMRSRNVKQAAVNGGQPCVGPTQETGPCDEPIQDIDCELSEWEAWTECSVTCGLGFHSRERGIQTAKQGFGNPCEGPLSMVDDCRMKKCPSQNCVWSDWTEWKSPGEDGMCSRSRKIYIEATGEGLPCEGPMQEVRMCLSVVDCEISEWSVWSPCDRSCGGGQSMRGRHITVTPKNGGKACPQDLEELRGCNESPCGGKHCEVSEWQAWGVCSNTCGRGTQIRERFIVNQANGGRGCDNLLAEARECGEIDVAAGENEDALELTGGGLDFGGDSAGLDSTGGGLDLGQQTAGLDSTEGMDFGGEAQGSGGLDIQGGGTYGGQSGGGMSVSHVAHSMTSSGGGIYGGSGGMSVSHVSHSGSGGGLPSSLIVQGRRLQGPGTCPGPKNCMWGFWSEWSRCTCTCDGGQKTRDRRIAQMPTPGGEPCEALHKEEIVPCNTQPCSKGACIDAVWNDWSQWEGCSKTCDGGVTWRHRTLRQKANDCGLPATGMAMEHAACNRGIPCRKDVDCEFGAWEPWSGCTMPCLGIKRRTRTIQVQGKENGKWCVGPLKQTSPCPSGVDCFGGPPVDCQLSSWEAWERCSTTCGPGQQNRQRTVEQQPENGGKFCDDALVETKSCGNAPCHTCKRTDCMWGQWEMWGACDKCGGQRKRFRRVIVQADCGGQICERAYAEEISNCSRVCHTPTYCGWQNWKNWGECTVSCGGDGFRTRVRFLEAHSTPIPGVPISTKVHYEEGALTGDSTVEPSRVGGMETTVGGYSQNGGMEITGGGYSQNGGMAVSQSYPSDGGMHGLSHSSHWSYSSHHGGDVMRGFHLQKKFDNLKERAKKVESHRITELLTSFGLGACSFLVLITMGKRLSRGFEEEAPVTTTNGGHLYTQAPVDDLHS